MNSIFDLFTKGIESTMSIYSTQVKSKFSKLKTLAQKFTKKVRNMFKKIVSFIFGKPKSLDDYVKTSDGYVSKQLVLRVCLCIIITFVFIAEILYPYCEGRLWSANLVVNTEKFHTFTGDAKVHNSGGEVIYIGSMTSGLPNGVGEVYEDGSLVYSGEMENNVYQGNGKLFNNGVMIYEGTFVQNLFDGDGISYFENGNIEFQGSFTQGNFLSGTEYYADGNKRYTGAFAVGKYDGYASSYNDDDANTLEYAGDFFNGMFNGNGKLYSNNVIIYSGSFVDGMMSGDGSQYDALSGNLMYVGEFQNDCYTNFGTLYNPNTGRKMYEGNFVLGEENGVGTLYADSGMKLFEGEFFNGEIDYVQFLGKDSAAVKQAFGNEESLNMLDECFNMTYKKIPLSFQLSYVDLNVGTQVQNIKILGTQEIDGFKNGMKFSDIIDVQNSSEYDECAYVIGEKEVLICDILDEKYDADSMIYTIEYKFADHYVRAYSMSKDGIVLYYEVGGL